jgi:alanine racemase
MDFIKRTWAEIDLDALDYNIKSIKSKMSPKHKVMGIVKADAYGHGDGFVARKLQAGGFDWFGVSNIEEAITLRACDIKKPILILGYTPAELAKTLYENDIIQCVYSSEYAKALAEHANSEGVKIAVHIKIDIGMGRLGFIFRHSAEESIEELVDVCAYSCFKLEGIFTHFPTADEKERGDTELQFARFCEVTNELRERGYSFEIEHCANSAAAINHPEFSLDMVRLGIILYGALPSDTISFSVTPRPTIVLKTVVSNIKTVRKGDAIGYGSSYIALTDMKIVTLPIGYADGFLRSNSNSGTPIMINQIPCKIVGRICMDQLMVDVSKIDKVDIGDEITMFGNDNSISLYDLARYNQTIPYEILCTLGARVPRFYRRNGCIENL